MRIDIEKAYKQVLEKVYRGKQVKLTELHTLMENPIDNVARIELLLVNDVMKARVHWENSGFPTIVTINED